jgi:hypothetical protein
MGMEILSLQGTPEPAARGLTRAEALLLSLGVHLLIVLLFLVVPERLPESVRRFFAARPAARPEVAMAPVTAPPVRPPEPDRIPLKFAYVKVPDDRQADPNPGARLLSDRNRRARQEVPTPPDARRFSRDPHSRGDSPDRVRPDPGLPAGFDTPVPAPAPAVRAGSPAAGEGGGGLLSEGRSVTGEPGALIPPDGAEGAAGRPAAGDSTGDAVAGHSAGSPGTPREARPPAPEGRPGGRGSEPAGRLRDALLEWRPGEFKFTFNNPAYLRGGGHGTLSFDTQDFPWGDYARRIYVIIRNNWLARIPLAAREGIRGFACWRFRIGREGGIGVLDLVHTSAVPPFERAAADALRASSPLPPLPEEFPHDSEGVTFCFYYNMLPEETE